jgi:heme/copper-type cytochrome/quinol oxidase subunit 1
LLRALLNMVKNTHLPDTLFSVGTAHLEFFVPAFVLLGLGHHDDHDGLERSGHNRWAWVGFVLIAMGSHVLAWSFLTLGLRGMPRRYTHYLEQYQLMHIGGTIGAILLVAGVIVALGTLWRFRRLRTGSTLFGLGQ